MNPFFKTLSDKTVTKRIGNICLCLIAWFAAQEIVAVLTIQMFKSVSPFATSLITSCDRIPPISRFITAFSSFFQSVGITFADAIVLTANLVLQFLVFAVFINVILNLSNNQSNQTNQSAFTGSLKSTFMLLPLFLTVSSIGLLLDVFLTSILIKSAFSNSFFVLARDGFVLMGFFCIMFVYVSIAKGENLLSATKKLAYKFINVCFFGCLPAFIISLITNMLYVGFLDSRFVLTTLFLPAKFTLQAFGWAIWAVVWLFAGNVYDNLNDSKDLSNTSMLKGAENEQILETSN
jgi:hypothetical protein